MSYDEFVDGTTAGCQPRELAEMGAAITTFPPLLAQCTGGEEALNFEEVSMIAVTEKINGILTPQGMARAQELLRSELVDYLRAFSDYDSEITSQAYRDFGDSRVAVVYWKRTRSVEVLWILFDEHLRPYGDIWEYTLSRPTGYRKGGAH